MKRTPLARRVPLQAQKPINRVSARRKAENKELAKILKELRGTPCVVRWDERCTGLAEQGDHILSRARGGAIADRENVRGVCLHCHGKLTTNPAEAERRGLTLHAWEVKKFA